MPYSIAIFDATRQKGPDTACQGTLCITHREFVETGSGWAARRILQSIAPLLTRNSTQQTTRGRAITDREELCRGSQVP